MSGHLHAPRRMVTIVALVLGVFTTLLTVPLAAPAQALCVRPALVGDWRNTDPGTRSMTRVIVGFNCGDTVLCDPNGNCTRAESYFTLRPFGKCHPTDCDWGVRRAESMGDGWQRAIYPSSYATRHVWVKTYAYYGRTYLRLWVHTDFTPADGRTDYTTDQWMLP